MSKNIGIDLGKKYIKLVYIDDKRLEVKVEDAEIYELEYKTEKEYFSIVGECIKEFTRKNKIKFAKLNFSISPDTPFILYNFFNIPKLKDRDITKALKYEMQSNIDYNINDYTLKWTTLTEDKIKEEIEVFVVGIKNKFIEYISNLSKFTWVIRSIELQPLEFAKNFSKPTSVLDIGKNNVRAYLYENNKIIDIITKEYDEEIIETSREIIRELETKNLKPIDKVFIPGFYGSQTDFLKRIEDAIHIPTHPLNLLVYDGDLKEENEIIEEEVKDDYSYILTNETAVDTTLEEKDDTELDSELSEKVNLEPINTESSNIEDINNTEFIFAINSIVNKDKTINFSTKTINFNFNNILLSAAITIIIANLGVNMIINKYDKLINEVSNANNVIEQNIEMLESDITTLNNDINLYNETIKKVDAIQSQKSWLSDMLYTIEKNIPKDVTLANIDIIEGKTVVQGYAKDYRDVAYFAIALEKYGKVEIDQLSTAGTDARLNGKKLVRAFTIRLDHQGIVLNEETKS